MRSRIVLILVAAVFLLPLYFMFTGSLQDIRGVLAMPPRLIPRAASFDNFVWLFQFDIGRWAINSALVVTLGVSLSVGVVCSGAYAFAFYQFPLKRVLWVLVLSGIMIPQISLVIPRFVVMRHLGMNGTLASVIVPGAVYPIGLYLARTYFNTVPAALLESARMDGANEAQILFRIVGPVSRPIITTLALFMSVHLLGDFMWQMLQLQRENMQTLLVGLTRAVMRYGGESDLGVNPVGRSLAVGVILLVPLLVVFFSASRYFTTALGGAIKE